MIFIISRLTTLVVACLATSTVAESLNAALSNCAPLGAVLPAPVAPSGNKIVQETVKAIEESLAQLASTLESSSLSIAIQSTNEQSPLLNFQSTPKHLHAKGTKKVTDSTLFRLGSVSKVYTVLAVLQLGVPLSDPITKYVPQLLQLAEGQETMDLINTPQWSEITIDALASQQAGIATQFQYDLYNFEGNLTEYGLPALPLSNSSQCYGDASDGLPPCTQSDFFRKFYLDNPIYAPYTTAVYSNMNYVLLGMVIEAVTNSSYTKYMQENIFDKLHLSHTTTTQPADKDGFIVQGWDYKDGFETPTGGLFASTSDLLAFGLSILESTLLRPVQTRAWLKPHGNTASIGTCVGAPWEIARANNVTTDRRLIDFYTKTGGLFDYNALLVLVPDYNISMALFFAGPEASFGGLQGILTQVVQAILPAIEEAGKAEATARYAGTYKTANSSIVLKLDNGPGLLVSKFVSNGKDILKTYPNITSGSASGTFGAPLVSLRLYPTGLQSSTQQAWRAVYSSTTPADVAQEDGQLFFQQGACESWAALDNILYGLTGLDDFGFQIGNTGHASAIMPRAFRQTLEYRS